MSAVRDSFESVPVIGEDDHLLKCGVVRVAIPASLDIQKWASELSQVTPMNMTVEGDGEYAFYRNIMDEPDFPFDSILQSDIGDCIQRYFGSGPFRLDDAFCIHYNTDQTDTSGSKHMDPSDVTVNMCLESKGVEGSEVLFHGVQPLEKVPVVHEEMQAFKVKQVEGYATIHWGRHVHQTMPLRKERRTNIVLTYCYTDPNKSDVQMRTCYDTQS